MVCLKTLHVIRLAVFSVAYGSMGTPLVAPHADSRAGFIFLPFRCRSGQFSLSVNLPFTLGQQVYADE